MYRQAWGDVDLGAVRDNTRALAELARPAALLAVVKADGYGHGAAPVAKAALDAGATWLGVALVEEGAALRGEGIDAPILVLSEPPLPAAPVVVSERLTPVVYTPAGIEALAKANVHADAPLPVHLKVDTGMHRVGCAPDAALDLVDAIAARDELELEGICTHFANADDLDRAHTEGQIARFNELLSELTTRGMRPKLVHAANSAGLLNHPDARYDLVRCGIALYGVAPAPELADRVALRPVLSLRAQVSHVRDLDAGDRVSYGLRYALPQAGRVATVPVGYADGVPRNLGLAGGEVLIRGNRYPIAGTVTMDQLMVDVTGMPSSDGHVEAGDDVVLLGRDGNEEITAQEWAERLGTIGYEIVTGIGPRVPRRYVS
jgi:alanine racemase